MKKKNIILLIIAIVMFILVGSTMAYFGWNSTSENKDQLVDVTVAGGTGSCDKLSDNNKLLYPTSTREKGRILKVTTKQQMATNAFVTWNLVVNSINETTLTTSGLKHKSFKYELVNDTTGVSYGTGSFENVTNGTTITLSTDKETLDYNKEYTFILYLWIDGTIGNNPLDMTNQPYNFDLNCNITGTSTKIVPTDTYELTNSDGTTYTPTYTGSGTKAVRSTAPLSKFREVRVDDTVVDSSNYTLTEGSTIVTFKESYLKTLSKGEHVLKVVSTDGFTTGKLTIVETAAVHITNLYTNASKTPATNNGITYNYANIYDTDSDDNTSGGLMNDRLGGTTTNLDGGNIRYYGASPNNYIYFNCSNYSNQSSNTCETWRIIGVFDGKVKIIRNESIDVIPYDNDYEDSYLESITANSTPTYANTMEYNNKSVKIIPLAPSPDAGENNYPSSSLKKILNHYYYNGIDYSGYYEYTFTLRGLRNDITRNMVADALWNLGGYNSSSIYPNQLYAYEKGTTVYSGNATTCNAKIGLMYPSDYGYATDLSKCTQTLNNYNNTTCKNNNWLFNSTEEWTIMPNSGGNEDALSINSTGKAEYNIVYYGDVNVRPTLYLNSTAEIASGDGSSSNPYTLKVS